MVGARSYCVGMQSLTGLGILAVAVLTWRCVVPRIRIDDPEAPDLTALVTARSTLAIALAAVAVAAMVTWLEPSYRLWLWAPYVALGLPLVTVDLRTTFLPKRLNALVTAAMAVGLVPLTVADWRAGVGATLGAAGAFLFFYAAWRLSPTLGFGDVRLALLIGAVSGQAGVGTWTTALLGGTVLGALHGIGHAVWARGGASRPQHFPFGPALWLGPVVASVVSATG